MRQAIGRQYSVPLGFKFHRNHMACWPRESGVVTVSTGDNSSSKNWSMDIVRIVLYIF
jgi:hypothetical protein